ncbi:MAG: DUF3887 domain-containing protein [Chloroflexi bacterium]|nr:DUF3887 domain-containing protein [Chloroflexota bacterium]
MSKSIVRAACGLLILLVVIAGLAACGPMSEPDYASQIAESALQSLSDGDYATHAALYTPDAQATFSEAQFNAGCQEIKSLIGDYIDKEFQKAETQDSYTVVYYNANFSEELEGVIVSIYFEEIDGEMYIAGFDLDSPKLLELSGE